MERILQWKPFSLFTTEQLVEKDKANPFDTYLMYKLVTDENKKKTFFSLLIKFKNTPPEYQIERFFEDFKSNFEQNLRSIEVASKANEEIWDK